MTGYPRRTVGQIALLAIGLSLWAYGQRIEDSRLTLIALGFFAAATVLRFARPRNREAAPDDE